MGGPLEVTVPFIMGVMADLSGDVKEPLSPVADRKFFEIKRDTFDDRMKAMNPRVAYAVPNLLIGEGDLMVDITFENMADFAPAAIVRKVEALRILLETRREFSNLVDESVDLAPRPDQLMSELGSGSATFSSESATGADQLAANISAIDAKLTRQINAILHHERFRQIESAWRGLHYLVTHSEIDSTLKIRVLNISKNDLSETLRKYNAADWYESPIFMKLHDEEYGQLGGEPYGVLVGDYYFGRSSGDVELLGQMARIAAAAHAPFIAGSDPSLMGMESWQELAKPCEHLRCP
jgi:type VI secretion system ImpB/VipA family protein